MNNAELITVSGHLVEAEPNKPVQIMPWGEFKVHGVTYRYTEESIPRIRDSISAHGVDLPIDYDHGISTNPPANGIAPAAGWMKLDAIHMAAGEPMTVRPEWTPAGARHVQAREFRYVSPTFHARKSDGVIIGLHSVALTNKPAIAGMPAIAAHSAADAAAERNDAMKSIATCLGLAAEATEDQIVAKVKELQVSAAQVRPLREAIAAHAGELGDTALVSQAAGEPVETIAAAMKTLALKAKNPPGMVAASDYEALKTRLGTVENDLRDRDCNALIAANATKLPPAKHEWFKKFYASDANAAREWIKEAPELVSSSATTSTTTSPVASDRKGLIAAARAKRQAEITSGKNMAGASERAFVHGELRSAGQPGLTDEEAREHALVG